MRRHCLEFLKLIYAPAMLLGFNGAALALTLRAGTWTHAALVLLFVGAAALSCVVERLIPYEPRQHVSPGEWKRDLLHALVNEGLSGTAVLLVPLVAALRPWPSFWPDAWPLAWQLLLAVLVADCGITLMHWASHHLPWLWRFHAVHHSVKSFHSLNGLLKHPVHLSLEMLAGTAPLVLWGLPEPVAALLAFAVALQLMLQHSNADIRLGPLRRWLALAPVHRFHHQKWAGVGDVNFGLFTTIWDRLLGTLVDDPLRRFVPGDFGIGTEPDYPQAYLQQLMRPFQRKT